MTPTQRELARHALGLPNPKHRSYRNRFVADPGSPDHDQWTEMVSASWAKVSSRRGPLTGGMDYFWLTEAGARLAINKAERLDAEDFPAAKAIG